MPLGGKYRDGALVEGVADDPTDVPRWTVFDSTGVLLGEVVTPRGLTVTSIGTDWMLGTWSDRTGAPHVRVHRIIKQ